jgi:hypothetical protein
VIAFLASDLPGLHVLAGSIQHEGFILFPHIKLLKNHIVYRKAGVVTPGILVNAIYSLVWNIYSDVLVSCFNAYEIVE